MNKLDEIALRVASEEYDVSFAENSPNSERMLRTIRKVVAEQIKDAEPVAFTNSCELDYLDFVRPDGGLVTGSMWKAYDKDSDIPLFTHPSNTAEIEQRVAEAIAKAIENELMYVAGVRTEMAAFVRRCKWREYQ